MSSIDKRSAESRACHHVLLSYECICVLLCAKASAEEAAASSPRSFIGLAGRLACPFRYFPTTGAEFHVLVAELLSLEASLGAQPGAGLFVDEILEICPSVCWTV